MTDKLQNILKDKYLYVYYALLLVVQICYTNAEYAPHICFRVAYIAAVILPCLFAKNWLPAVFTCFMSLSSLWLFAYTYLPSGKLFYGAIALLALVLVSSFKKFKNFKQLPLLVVLCAVYVTAVDLIGSVTVQPVTYGFLLVLATLCCIDDYEDSRYKWSMAFAVLSMVLSAYLLFNMDKFSIPYEAGLTRLFGWTDPNYFGMILGMGIMASVNELYIRQKDLHIAAIILFVANIMVTLPVLFLLASRGAVLSAVVGVFVVFTFSKIKVKYKCFIALAVLVYFLILYFLGCMDVLIYRCTHLQNGTVSSGRVDMWESTATGFFSWANLDHVLFGYSYAGAMKMTGGYGFHNDFVAFMVEYGIIGLLIFIAMNLYLVFHTVKNKIIDIPLFGAFLFYLTCFITLEPITLGVVPFFFFYAYMICTARSNKLMLECKKTETECQNTKPITEE